jgi:hypothetical protein
MIDQSEDFVRDLVTRFTPLAPLLAQHLKENFGELLPHVFFGDVTRWFEGELASDAMNPEAIGLLRYLESIYDAANDDVQNVIDVSFVENLTVNGAGAHLLGPQLQEVARALGILYSTDDDGPGSNSRS